MTSPLQSVPLSADDVDTVVFRQPRPGTRGYHDGEVDAFLTTVAAEMRRLEAENKALHERLRQPDAGGQMRGELRRMEAEKIRAEERLRALEAELRAALPPANPQVMKLAERTAEQYLAEVRQETGEVRDKAATEAALLVSEAELQASTIVADARHRHAERLAELPARRAAALERIEALRAEAQRRRDSVTGELSARLQDLLGT
ncbi:DivIVA domain-containing protein [Actinoplanes sp. DH11]|uniref:DivIVA domain-containing protein n=1 Tax=Actinoplanes sp. DH11 TaxID=2857011 RepID=UPI001E43D2DC|nr:DivIVA domain-containing protein [Actinoplanes sp. DH11]